MSLKLLITKNPQQIMEFKAQHKAMFMIGTVCFFSRPQMVICINVLLIIGFVMI